jgi:alpha-beta hydrolase superfamily lysophospholipase
MPRRAPSQGRRRYQTSACCERKSLAQIGLWAGGSRARVRRAAKGGGNDNARRRPDRAPAPVNAAGAARVLLLHEAGIHGSGQAARRPSEVFVQVFRKSRCILVILMLALGWSRGAQAGGTQKLPFVVRTKALTLTVYRPAGTPQGTVIMGSGDAGWVGLAVRMSEFLAQQGLIVIGFNVREYLSSFTAGNQHVSIADVRSDYHAMSELLAHTGLVHRPVLLSGVSEGAALAVVAAGDPGSRTWVDGVVAIGLPTTAELAWRWMDIAALITRRDADEPSFAPWDYVGAVSPIPLAMIQSSTDEYITEADRVRLLSAARAPKRLTMIAAANHRFTDKLPELRNELLAAIAWVNSAAAASHK